MIRTLALAGLISLASASALADQIGHASWYGAESGNRTANGERFHPGGMTAAHRTLPFGTRVRVTVLSTGRSCAVRINDRGPFVRGRVIDLAHGAARACGISGVARVRLTVLR
ncbi:septal ring lytic transglycosylase RlpA family protein [Kaistia sp. MMO-174]|uniref:septal ring lytic transglycosylase RlpA family protein n=1 Tax=Kaistia sp. MMO-174 TaxID=3081256 RepID=UPI00301863AF